MQVIFKNRNGDESTVTMQPSQYLAACEAVKEHSNQSYKPANEESQKELDDFMAEVKEASHEAQQELTLADLGARVDRIEGILKEMGVFDKDTEGDSEEFSDTYLSSDENAKQPDTGGQQTGQDAIPGAKTAESAPSQGIPAE